ncbi:MAG: hypothetical protein AMS27_05380 [Bacteroides sp. SM23_62_1]|nr:MAG: hypothetical protein AMS27_05380 [Bacteroides sp. SM23_62_1]
MKNPVIYLFFSIILFTQCRNWTAHKVEISGELKKWHRITLTFSGPSTSENDSTNPFLDYRLDVKFVNGDREYLVPGYFAADGNAAETSAIAGNKWRVHFCPDKEGVWTYTVSFKYGKEIAVADDTVSGKAVYFNGQEGNFEVAATDKTGRDFRSKGKLQYVNEHYLRFSETGGYFLKGGTDSPENFLAYEDFDGTIPGRAKEQRPGDNIPTTRLHTYRPHTADWQDGDPVWQKTKGKNIIGALNYLASKGMNSVYMLTMNVDGDGDDVWPWTNRGERYRFDCSKMDQWEIVFCHMDHIGIMLHLVTQETENECLLDNGDTGIQRKLYYRELVARFAHHLAIIWNLGEENGPAGFSPLGQTDQQRKDAATYLKKINPYKDLIVIHTHSSDADRNKIITPLVGYPDMDGLSIQVGNLFNTHEQTLKWLRMSNRSNKLWVVCVDEIGPSHIGVKPDSADVNHDDVRKYVLWANLMAGGGGVEWYFGFLYPDNDLSCEDWKSRDEMWDQTRYALQFFQNHLPFWDMISKDELTKSDNDYCLAIEGEIYAIYLPEGGTTLIDLRGQEGEYVINWFNPRKGGEMFVGTQNYTSGGQVSEIGYPPEEPDKDWVAIVVLNI